MAEIRLWSPAKINFFLHVKGKRSDGYHDLFSLMQMIDLGDELQFQSASEGIQLNVIPKNLPEDTNNLVFQAADLLRREFKVIQGVRITLRKSIPVSAGLGGGSSNAAATLLALNSLWGLSLSLGELDRLGEKLGADVPFFFHGPLALAQGKGEQLFSLKSNRAWWILLINPGFSVSTAWAFQGLDAQGIQGLHSSISCQSSLETLEKWLTKAMEQSKIGKFNRMLIPSQGLRETFRNDLEPVVIKQHPDIGEIKKALLSIGALVAIMSGSGSTVLGLFEERSQMEGAKKSLQKRFKWSMWETHTLFRSPWEEMIAQVEG